MLGKHFDRRSEFAVQVCEEPPWQQLATATHVAQQLPAQDAAASKPHIEAWEQALQAVELHLLQLHIEATLQKPCQSAIQF